MTAARTMIVVGVVLVLGVVLTAVLGKERIRQNGEVIYFQLASRDPRAMMQGDYMALEFKVAQELEVRRGRDLPDGTTRLADIVVDDSRIADLAPSASERKIRYRIRDGRVWLGTNAFFFPEGTGDRYSGAMYGEFRLDRATGEAVLVGLRDFNLKPL